MNFSERKSAMLKSLATSVTDKSPKGSVDTEILPLLTLINSHPSYFTTSSCSGRISILSQPRASTTKKKARGGTWIYISHSLADSQTILSLLFPDTTQNSTDLVFRFEPVIISVECKDVESASFLVSVAIRSGFRESGITSVSRRRVIVGIRSSIRMEVPLGESGRVLVTEEFVRFLVGVANEKMEMNWKRMEGFFNVLKELGFGEVECGGVVVENGVDCSDGQVGVLDCELSTAPISVTGEPSERLSIWGHDSCTLNSDEIIVFGGFGGVGRHARRNDLLVLNSSSGELKLVDAKVAPCPRLGHTASLVGNFLYVIGGRADPLNVLNDVWILDTVKKEWKLVECTGIPFLPRHRHAAAVVGSDIYVFGGLNNDGICSSMHMLKTENMQWEEVLVDGDQPCARHSHAMVAYGTKLFVFGGYNGERAFGDLFSFEVKTCIWKKEKTFARSPHARFSHSMFQYGNFLGLIGGCPFRLRFQELALFDLRINMWKYVTLNCIGNELLVRSTANVVGDDLVMIGGGAACYAFGTKFSQPLKINLLPLMSLKDENIPFEIKKNLVIDQNGSVKGENTINSGIPQLEKDDTLIGRVDLDVNAKETQPIALHWALQLERKYAKLGKDILKKCGWLDLGRKVYSQTDGLHICFPVIKTFCAVFQDKKNQCGDSLEVQNDIHQSKPFIGDGILLNDISHSNALNILKECRATVVADDIVEARKTAKSPLQIMTDAVASLVKLEGLSEELLEQLPTRWERLGDIVVLPVTSFKDPVWDSFGEELWFTVAKSLNTRRLARQGRVAPTGTRDSTLEILVGDNGWVEHRENGIIYSFDAAKCMFSWGNLSEKIRMGNLDCKDEVIVDLFAGIGYFVLPFLVRAQAKMVYACEWNPHAVEALKHNLDANSVSGRCIILEGDNRITAPNGVADRVCLGLIPTSEGSWATAIRALRSDGGVLHVHGNVKDTEEGSWTEYVARSMKDIAQSEGHCWEVMVEHVERVKWYAPHIRHVVADVRCKQILT